MNAVIKKSDKKLDIIEVLNWLEKDGMVTSENAHMLRTLAVGKEYQEKNALCVIAERQWIDQRNGSSLLSLEILTTWLADKVGMPYHRIDPLKIEVAKVTSVMSYAYAARFNILPVSVDDKFITIATAEPNVSEWEQELSRINNKEFKRVISNPEDISRYLLEFYTVSKSVNRAESEALGTGKEIGNLESLMELGRAGKLDANDQHVINIVDWLLQYAFDQRASDIHLEPRREQGNVRFRIDGVMHQVYQVPSTVMAAVSSRIKILGRMDVAEKRRPQDGRLKTRTPDGIEVELRLSTMPTAFGEKLVMRIFDPEVLVKNFRELGFSQSDDERWQSMIEKPNGIILVTGPTGSGKTTTLYTSLKQLAKPEVNVCTVEDPIELVESSFNQMQVQHNIGLDFSTGVRTLLRQDPDIIMIGEIRDRETADIAIQAALTGHLVVSTLHTNDAPSAVTRLMEVGVPAYLIQSTILGIMAQRLVRVLCPHCKQEAEIDEGIWKSLVKPWKPAKPKKVFKPVGCLECRNTGFMGRMGLYEMFTFSHKIKDLIVDDIKMQDLKKQAMAEGMRPLRLSGAQKVAAGLTTVEEVLRVAPPVEH
ncbi:MAG: type II secretion system protein E [endosymbiont of Galathealinum brachiosum]|uniref:Type II secretion system protein E n=1 Tax=endosymbiont of Galathealinum brachiosum TaxID=2200906 RepID=A0A370D8R7_9GAMM|nr:MAG: type II secretion system protein E [endosymbiont of Galathealinum brachiosum]